MNIQLYFSSFSEARIGVPFLCVYVVRKKGSYNLNCVVLYRGFFPVRVQFQMKSLYTRSESDGSIDCDTKYYYTILKKKKIFSSMYVKSHALDRSHPNFRDSSFFPSFTGSAHVRMLS